MFLHRGFCFYIRGMIKQNELRIGNYYRCKIYNGNNDVILPFTWQEFKYTHLFDPIPLTPEILEKCGFDINGFWEFEFILSDFSKLVLDLRQGYLWLRESDLSKKPENDSIVCLWNRDLKKEIFLHQLQNLYFALTGEELDVSIGTPLA
jgi:hypothetical protein